MKSLFTKMFATGIIAAGAVVANGQVNENGISSKSFGQELVGETNLTQFTKETLKKHGKLAVEEWYSYMGALGENGEAYTYFTGTSIMPDSLTVQIFNDDNGNPYTSHVGQFCVGQMFDPTSEHFALIPETPPLSRFNAYTVDSIAFFYKYMNANPGVTDTILIQVFNNSDVSALTWQSDQSRTAGTTYTPALNRSESPTKEYKFPISESTADFYSSSIGSFSGTMEFESGLSTTGASSLTAYTIAFIPGMSYEFGDTIVNDSLVTGDTKINSFMPLIVRQGTVNNPAFLADTTMNHGVFAFTRQRYSAPAAEWTFPYNPPGTLARQHVYSLFKLASPNVSIGDIDLTGYGLGNAFPNPASSNAEVTIPFAIGQAGTVYIEMFDLVGKSITSTTSELTAGSHTETLSTNNLKPGIYLYTVTAGNYTASKKFTVR
ncbi:MAG: hypothetical protein ACI9JN_002227 [Bacteroidia bacterium]|jgi:hypothetical protein